MDNAPISNPVTAVHPPTASELAKRALTANQKLQYDLAKRAELLQAEIQEAENLLRELDTDEAPEDPQPEIQIPAVKKPSSLFFFNEYLNPKSPFYSDSLKRNEYASRITAQPMNPKEVEALRTAVKNENQRLQAYRTQTRDPEPVDLQNNTEGVDWNVVAEKVSDASTSRFKAAQCRIKWVGDKHPSINRSEWKPSELQRLTALVEAAKQASNERIDWVKIAKELGTDRTPLDVMDRGVPRQRHQWDARSDQRLLEAVDLYGLNNWMSVARHVSEHATPNQCQNRYIKSVDPTNKRGTWTPIEDERLKKAVAAFGSSWVRVAEFIPGRTNDQCHERWTEQLNANSSKNVWSESEDQLLLASVGTMGRQWKVISEKIGNGKTGPSCRMRYNKLAKASAETTPGPSSTGSTPMPNIAAPSTSLSSNPIHAIGQSATAHTQSQQSPAGHNHVSQISLPSPPPAEATSGSQALPTKRVRKRAKEPEGGEGEGPVTKKRKAKETAVAVTPTALLDEGTGTSAPTAKSRPKPRPVARPKPTALDTTPDGGQLVAARSTTVTTAPEPQGAFVSQGNTDSATQSHHPESGLVHPVPSPSNVHRRAQPAKTQSATRQGTRRSTRSGGPAMETNVANN